MILYYMRLVEFAMLPEIRGHVRIGRRFFKILGRNESAVILKEIIKHD